MAKGGGSKIITTPKRTPDDYGPTSTPTPTASPSPSPSRPLTATSTPTPTRGPITTQLETSYHKRLRTLLLDYKRLSSQWTQLVLRSLLKQTRSTMELYQEIESTLNQIAKRPSHSVRAGYLLTQSTKLSDQIALIQEILIALTSLLASLDQLSLRAEQLVLEAARVRGQAFAFREPMWVTWSLAKFADALSDQIAPYRPSLGLVRDLLDVLLRFPPLPLPLLPSSASTSTSTSPLPLPLSLSPNPDSSPSFSTSTPTPTPTSVPTLRRPPPEELQACLSLLAVQPLLPGRGSDRGIEAWEELCRVEVGGWA